LHTHAHACSYIRKHTCTQTPKKNAHTNAHSKATQGERQRERERKVERKKGESKTFTMKRVRHTHGECMYGEKERESEREREREKETEQARDLADKARN